MQRKKRGPMLGLALLLVLIIGAAAIAFVMREHRAVPASAVSEVEVPTAAAEDDAQTSGALDINAFESAPPSEEAPPAPPPSDELVLRFSAVSWVEISDASGKRLVSRMGAPNEEIRVQGEAPFEVLFGNARSVTLEYNGKPYTNIPIDRRGVANFRLQRPREE
jgi:cytoskeleton protein RodZ